MLCRVGNRSVGRATFRDTLPRLSLAIPRCLFVHVRDRLYRESRWTRTAKDQRRHDREILQVNKI